MEGKQVCCIVAFVFIFIILVGAICWSNMGFRQCDNFTNVISASTDTLKHKLMGGKYYHALGPHEKVLDQMKKLHESGKPGVFVLVSDRCGYCRKLKESGTLNELAKEVLVCVLHDNHPEYGELMKMLKARGVPTIAIFYNGKLNNYEGARDTRSIRNAIQTAKR